MKIQIIRGTIGRKNTMLKGDEGFSMLVAGTYNAQLIDSQEIIVFKKNGQKAYLPLLQIYKKIDSREIKFLDSNQEK